MNVQITPAARERMRNFIASESNAVGVRFGVRKMGCSGFAYTIDVANDIHADDIVNEVDGITLVVDPKSLPMIEGTQIDFAREGLNATFVFRNPNVTGECGCGESFTVDSAA
ncbi:MAG TPA: iron-sulfur cluster assembly accessory protein [Rudaea sp.]|jgi:iron-sulfur cluster assembly protein|nr:iron-sulfur cluster assembly accessory protein [Rudaea sp.]